MATYTHTPLSHCFIPNYRAFGNLFKSLITIILVTVFLSACSDTGGNAGDTDGDPEAVALITPLVGLYDLPGNWEGLPESEAYLEIQTPDISGNAVVLLFRVNEFRNCIEARPTRGTAAKDLFSNQIFLDRILALENSILSLSGSNLVISLAKDVSDINANGNFDEPATLTAPRIDMMASDLGDTCS